jgi:DNA (cytosine-5)-methyltransferase 1
VINVIELFAGVGGFRLGLEKKGNFNVVWGNQWEPSKVTQHAFNCYSNQFEGKGTHVNRDIATVTEEEIKDINAEVIVGGFPCQDYSVARSLSGEKGIDGKKGVLFWEIKRFIEIKNPKYVLLENVDRLLKSPSKQRGRDFAVTLATFRDLGYFVEWRVINAAEYGQAQRRRRVFIFAYRKDTPFAQKQQKESVENILHDNGFFVIPFPVQANQSEKHPPNEYNLNEYEDIVGVSDKFKGQFWNAGIMKNGNIYTAQLLPIEEEPITLGQILEENVDDKYYLNEDAIGKFRYLKDQKKIERTAANGHKYTFSEGSMAFPESLDKPGRTMLTSEGSINRSTHVVQDEKGYRILTPVECERLNGFPDNWTKDFMTERMRYFCMGNALVVGLVERMANRINEIDNIIGDQIELDLFEEEMV